MVEIRTEHVEWAVVDRLGQMLDEVPPPSEFNVTHSFALFSSILCWTLQHLRIGEKDRRSDGDRVAAWLCEQLENEDISAEPWAIRMVERAIQGAKVPAPRNFGEHKALRFLKNLRDAMAHGDARIVVPFHTRSHGVDRALLGFLFNCEEHKYIDRKRVVVWTGEIILLEQDMREIGLKLAKRYCDALREGTSIHPTTLGSMFGKWHDCAPRIGERLRNADHGRRLLGDSTRSRSAPTQLCAARGRDHEGAGSEEDGEGSGWPALYPLKHTATGWFDLSSSRRPLDAAGESYGDVIIQLADHSERAKP